MVNDKECASHDQPIASLVKGALVEPEGNKVENRLQRQAGRNTLLRKGMFLLKVVRPQF